MGHGAQSVFTTSAPSAATFTAVVDLQRSWARIAIAVPASTTFDVVVNASDSLTGTYQRISGLTITSATSNVIVPYTNIPARYLKLEQTTASANSSFIYKIICAD